MNDVKHLPLWQKDAKKLMRKIYMIYAKYGIYAVEGQRADAYHTNVLRVYMRILTSIRWTRFVNR